MNGTDAGIGPRAEGTMSYILCQRCDNESTDSWNVKSAEFHVGRIEHWKVQLCPDCVKAVEQAVLAALKGRGGPVR